MLEATKVRPELTEAQRQTMVDMGKALYTIREKRLFRGEYATFEDYVRRKWGAPMDLVELAIQIYLAERN